MTKWTIRKSSIVYAKFEFDKELKLVEQSDQARKDNLQQKLDQEQYVFDPRYSHVKFVQKPRNAFDADVLLTAIFSNATFETESEGVGWEKVLTRIDEPGIGY